MYMVTGIGPAEPTHGRTPFSSFRAAFGTSRERGQPRRPAGRLPGLPGNRRAGRPSGNILLENNTSRFLFSELVVGELVVISPCTYGPAGRLPGLPGNRRAGRPRLWVFITQGAAVGGGFSGWG